VLARLDEVPGVRESRVDWTGRYVLLALEDGADEARVAGEASSLLGDGAARLDRGREAEQVDAYRRGEPWMRAGETLRLSRAEARIIAEREGARAAREAGLDADASRRMVAVLEDELAAAFERVERRDGPVERGLGTELPLARERALARCREFLTPEQVARLEAALPLE